MRLSRVRWQHASWYRVHLRMTCRSRCRRVGRVPFALLTVTATILALASCSDLLFPERDTCRHLNALPDTATMEVGARRAFEAAGFQESNQPGSCIGTIRLGFHWRSSVPGVATVGLETGEVTAHAVGTTTISAHLDQPERNGYMQLRVVAAP